MKKSLLIMAMVTLLTALIYVVETPPLAAKTLRWAFSGDVYSMDPHAHTVSFTNAFHYHIYETLARYDKDLKIEPALATSGRSSSPPCGDSPCAEESSFIMATRLLLMMSLPRSSETLRLSLESKYHTGQRLPQSRRLYRRRHPPWGSSSGPQRSDEHRHYGQRMDDGKQVPHPS